MPRPRVDARATVASRVLRLQAFEVMIFITLAVLLAMCVTVAPIIAASTAPTAGRRAPGVAAAPGLAGS